MDYLEDLKRLFGVGSVLSAGAASSYCTDYRGRYQGDALAVVFPSSTAQVMQLVSWCSQHQIAMVPQGGNTGLCGGSVPLAQHHQPQVVVNLSRMQAIREIDPLNYTMTVEAGCTLAQVCRAAEAVDRLFPLGLTAIADRCEIGGNIATNAGGIGVLRYGNMRDLVMGLEVVLPSGECWHGLRGLRKDNTGYDLKHLFIGSEGTLGIVTAAVLKLFPRPQASASACIAVRGVDDAVALLAHIRAACGDVLSAFELMSQSCMALVLKHIDGTTPLFEQDYPYCLLIRISDVLPLPLTTQLSNSIANFGKGVLDFKVAESGPDVDTWWLLRRSINEAQKREGISIKHDISVPVSAVASFIQQADALLQQHYPGVRIVAFGHMGDGNIHYNVSMPDPLVNTDFIRNEEVQVNRLVYQLLKQFNGSISAEHGLGQLKRSIIADYKTPLELQIMLQIKRNLDPLGLMNPGKLLEI